VVLREVKLYSISLLILLIGILAGCGGVGLSSLSEKESVIPLDNINLYLKKSLPKRMKTSFGKMRVTGATALPGDKDGSLDFMVYFNIITFEIPEGLDGSVTMTSSLRYSVPTKSLHPEDINVTNLSFANQSLVEYVSAKARREIPKLAKRFLLNRELYRVENGKKRKALSKFKTTPDAKLILYFK
jgi:hypothetical protein